MFHEGEGGKDVEGGGGEQDHRHLSHGPLRSCEITRCEDEFLKQGCLHLNLCAIILVKNGQQVKDMTTRWTACM